MLNVSRLLNSETDHNDDSQGLGSIEYWRSLGDTFDSLDLLDAAAAAYRNGSDSDPLDRDMAYLWTKCALHAKDLRESRKALARLALIDRVFPAGLPDVSVVR